MFDYVLVMERYACVCCLLVKSMFVRKLETVQSIGIIYAADLFFSNLCNTLVGL